MKNNVIKFILAVMIIAAPSMAHSQDRGDRGSRGDMEKRMKEQQDALKKDLKLNKKQSAAFDKVQATHTKKRNELMQSMRGGGNIDREAMREKMTKMNESLNKEMKEILDAKQYKKYQKIQEERRQNRGQRGQGRGGQRGGGR